MARMLTIHCYPAADDGLVPVSPEATLVAVAQALRNGGWSDRSAATPGYVSLSNVLEPFHIVLSVEDVR